MGNGRKLLLPEVKLHPSDSTSTQLTVNIYIYDVHRGRSCIETWYFKCKTTTDTHIHTHE